MWCGLDAAAALITHFVPEDPWDRSRVWLHIRSIREKRGERVTDLPRGGSYSHETVGAIMRAGLTVSPNILWTDLAKNSGLYGRKGMTVGNFLAKYGHESWFLTVSGHAFAHLGGQPPLEPSQLRRYITQAYRVTRPEVGQ